MYTTLVAKGAKTKIESYTPENQHDNEKTNIWVDVSPIKNGDFPLSC